MAPLPAHSASSAPSRPKAPKASVLRYDVFLSHAGHDRAWAEHITGILEGHGLRVFLDTRSIPTGTDFDDTIARAVRRSTLMVLLVSAHSMRRESYDQTELRHARHAWDRTFADRILYVRLDASAPPAGVGARAMVLPTELESLPRRVHERLKALRRRASTPMVIALLVVALVVGVLARLESASPTSLEPRLAGESPSLLPVSTRRPAEAYEVAGADVDPPKVDRPKTMRTKRVSLSPGVAVELALVPAGQLRTTRPSATGNPEDPAQRVDVVLPAFWIMTTEVTQGQWRAVMGEDRPRCAEACDDRYPVRYVTHAEALAFANAMRT